MFHTKHVVEGNGNTLAVPVAVIATAPGELSSAQRCERAATIHDKVPIE
jgi:hypothetical protein